MHITNYPSITQFQQHVVLKDFRKPTKKEYVRYARKPAEHFPRCTHRSLLERCSFFPCSGRRSIAGGRCSAGVAQSSLRQRFRHAQLVMNHCAEGVHSLSWVSRTPDVSANG